MLKKCGYEGFDNIIVSNEYNASKRSLLLYEYIKEQYGVEKSIFISAITLFRTIVRHENAILNPYGIRV